MIKKELNRQKRHFRIRKKVIGTSEFPRLAVRRTLTNLHVQVIDDYEQKTLFGMSTNSKEVKTSATYGGNKTSAEALGNVLASKLSENGIKKVKFDRAGYQYHGRIKTLADSLRKNGIEV